MLCFQHKLIARAIQLAGGTRPLSVRLGVDEHSLILWMDDKAAMPARVFLALADLILEDDVARAAQDRRSRPRVSPSEDRASGQSNQHSDPTLTASA